MLRRPHSTHVPDASRLIRYRFESPDDLYRHLRFKDGFFVPANALAGQPGERAIVEVGFPGAADPPLLHGRIREHDKCGFWLDVPAARATARWVPGPDSPRRQHKRVACDLFIEVKPRGEPPWVCRVIDLSAGGLRVRAASMELGVAGDEIEATMLSPEPTRAHAPLRSRVAWAGRHEAGLEILESGEPLQRLVAAAVERWSAVQETVHDAGCVCAAPLLRAG